MLTRTAGLRHSDSCHLVKPSEIAVAGMKTPTLFLVFVSSVEQENTEIGMPKQDQPSFQKICSNTCTLNYFDMVPVVPLLLLLVLPFTFNMRYFTILSSYNKIQQDALYLNFIFKKNSTCFE